MARRIHRLIHLAPPRHGNYFIIMAIGWEDWCDGSPPRNAAAWRTTTRRRWRGTAPIHLIATTRWCTWSTAASNAPRRRCQRERAAARGGAAFHPRRGGHHLALPARTDAARHPGRVRSRAGTTPGRPPISPACRRRAPGAVCGGSRRTAPAGAGPRGDPNQDRQRPRRAAPARRGRAVLQSLARLAREPLRQTGSNGYSASRRAGARISRRWRAMRWAAATWAGSTQASPPATIR